MKFKPRAPKFFKEDVSRKLISLFFACLIWYFVNRHISEVEIFKNINVQVEPGNNQLVVSINKPISVEIRGPKDVLDRLESKDIQVSVRGNFSPGVNEVLIKEQNIKLPSDLIVEKIIDKRISVDVDIIEEKTVDVRLRYNNTLSPNYDFRVTPYIEPNKVTVRGPRRQLAKISYLYTEAVTIGAQRTKDFRVTAKIMPFEGIIMPTNNVTVNVELKKRFSTKSLPVQKVHVLYTGSKERPELPLTVGEAYANVSGPPDIVEGIDINSDVRLFIEIGDEPKESYKVKFWCRYGSVVQEAITPPDITVAPVTPPKPIIENDQ